MPLRELLFLRMSLFLCVKDGKRRRVVSCHIEEMRSSCHDSDAFFFRATNKTMSSSSA